MTQAAYKRNRKRCVQMVLNGHWKYEIQTAPPRVTPEEQEAYWGRLFSRESPDDQRQVVPVRAPQWDVVAPITPDQVQTALKSMRTDSAAGPDKITVRLLRSCPTRTLTMAMNIWLAAGRIPNV